MSDKKVIGVAQVLQHLKDGMTREDIAQHYGITMSECKILFKDERLKGKKTIKKPSFILVEDETYEIPVKEVEEVASEEETEEKEEVQEETSEDQQQDQPEPQKKGFGEKFLKPAKKEEETEEKAEEVDPISTNAPKATWD